MKVFSTKSTDFTSNFEELLGRGKMDIDSVTPRVQALLDEIKTNADDAIMEQVKRFDRWSPQSFDDLQIKAESMKQAYEALDTPLKDALHLAYERIFAFHQKQLPKSWLDFEQNGSVLGQKVTPVEKAGLYIPGGKAAYPSSLLMNAIPAIVAGVQDIIVCTPTPDDEINSLLLAAMHICNIKKAYKIGGASAIGAMAFGTQSIEKVDVVTGPGNIYVATAKKLVYGEVNIDMIAGPSEIGILADESADITYLAYDLLSQAEHDEMASSILITPSIEVAQKTEQKIEELLPTLKREKIARESCESRGAIIITETMEEATSLMNTIAPEHLELMVSNPFELLPTIENAGAIFMGHYTPEPIGDYIAGPNHTLPTGGTAKFYSPLGVENFLKKSSIISMSQRGMDEIGNACALLAECEGLHAHEMSVRVRLQK